MEEHLFFAFQPIVSAHSGQCYGYEAVPQGFERFERLIEVVTGDEGDRLQARSRWKHYADRGYAITRHDLAAHG